MRLLTRHRDGRGHRIGKAYENVRMPNRILASPGSNQPCSATNPGGYATSSSTADGLTASCNTGAFALAGSAAPGQPGAGLNSRGIIIASGSKGNYTDPGELIFYPFGFRPKEGIKEDDYQYNAGLKFNVMGWDVDTNVGYGKDIDNIYTWNSGNRSLFIDTHTTPRDFYDGQFTATEATFNIDITKNYNVGLATRLPRQ